MEVTGVAPRPPFSQTIDHREEVEMPVLWDEVEAIIEADCKVRYRYITPSGQTCALGGLALAAGVSPETLAVARKVAIIATGAHDRTPLARAATAAVAVIREAIAERFGLTPYQQDAIQMRNDGERLPSERRRLVRARVRKMAESAGAA